MRKTLVQSLIVFCCILLTSDTVFADYSVVSEKKSSETFAERVLKLKTYLELQGSILSTHSEKFVEIADKYGLRYSFLPAICGRESTFAKHYIKGTFNCYGWGPSIKFQSWEDGIEKVAKGLKENYITKWGKDTVGEIAPIYAESQTWASGVSLFIAQIESTKIPSEHHELEPSL